MVEVPNKDFKVILRLLKIQRDMFEDASKDKTISFVKRKTASQALNLAEKLLNKYN